MGSGSPFDLFRTMLTPGQLTTDHGTTDYGTTDYAMLVRVLAVGSPVVRGLESTERRSEGVGEDVAEALVALALADAVALTQAFDADGGVSHG